MQVLVTKASNPFFANSDGEKVEYVKLEYLTAEKKSAERVKGHDGGSLNCKKDLWPLVETVPGLYELELGVRGDGKATVNGINFINAVELPF